MTSKQRAYLRGLANNKEAIFQVGKSGITKVLIEELEKALEARELIKISVLETAPENVKELAQKIAFGTKSIVVQTVGNKITLFKQKKKNSKIELPK